MSKAEFETIKYEVSESILTLTLARPERLNAFNAQMRSELVRALDSSDADDDIRAVVVTGSGRAFCAGADLATGASTFDRSVGEAAEFSDGSPRDGAGVVTLRMLESKKPLIAAINGPAIGAGVTVTLPMDVRLASEAGRFGFVFTRRGIVPEAASSWFLPRIVGISQAMEWTASGRVFDAEEALRGGLVRSIHPPGELLPEAYGLAREIADFAAPVSVSLARKMMWSGLWAPGPIEAHEVDSRAIELRGQSNDAYEGIEAFLEKRPAVFRENVTSDLPEVGISPPPGGARLNGGQGSPKDR